MFEDPFQQLLSKEPLLGSPIPGKAMTTYLVYQKSGGQPCFLLPDRPLSPGIIVSRLQDLIQPTENALCLLPLFVLIKHIFLFEHSTQKDLPLPRLSRLIPSLNPPILGTVPVTLDLLTNLLPHDAGRFLGQGLELLSV